MREVKLREDLPDWFDINKYNECDKLSLNEWADQLEVRSYLKDPCVDADTFYQDVYGLSEREILDEIREKGIPQIKPKPMVDNLYKSTNYEIFESMSTNAIRPLSSYEMFKLGAGANSTYNRLTPRDCNDLVIQEIRASYQNDPWDHYRRAYQKEDDEEFQFLEDGLIKVDLSLPDRELLRQMKKFLPAYRKALGIEIAPKQPTSENIKRLIDYKTLALLDLHIWERLENATIKPSIYIGALYPDYIKDRSDLVKFKEFAFKIVTYQFTTMLRDKDGS